MGNVSCFTPKRYIIDYTTRKIVVSQGIQCNLLLPSSNTINNNSDKIMDSNYTNTTLPSINNTQSDLYYPHHCHCGITNPQNDYRINCCKSYNSNNQITTNSNTTINSKYQPVANYKRKTFHNIKDNPEALVSLSETFSESSLEEFLQRKRTKNRQNNKIKSLGSSLSALNELPIAENNSNDNNFIKYRKRCRKRNRTYKRINHRHNNHNYETSSNNSSTTTNGHDYIPPINRNILADNTNDLNNSADIESNHSKNLSDNKIISPTLPKKSILKQYDNNSDNNLDEKVVESNLNKTLSRSTSLCSDKLNRLNTTTGRCASVLSDHETLNKFLSALKSTTCSPKYNDELITTKESTNNTIIQSKNVNFMNQSELIKDGELINKSFTKTNIIQLPDGRIKKRFLLRETHKLFDILNDPKDRRIRAICDRYQCDMEIFVRPPKIGLMHFAVEILAPDRYSLRMCARELDSSMKWCISSQMF